MNSAERAIPARNAVAPSDAAVRALCYDVELGLTS